MPRIYALAKELGLDSKDLVEVCTKAGVTGKGSALASLSSDEVETIKSYLKGGRSASKPASAKTAERKPVVGDVQPGFTRDDYIAPAGATGKPKTIVSTRSVTPASGANKSEQPKSPVKREPVVKLAAMPASAEPLPSAPAEPTPQQPELRLPPDAIRGAKEGAKAPLEQFTKQDKRRRPGETKQAGSEKVLGVTPEAPLAKAAGHKRRGKSEIFPPKEEKKGTGLAGMAGTRHARQQSRRSKRPVGAEGGDDETPRTRRGSRPTRKGTNTAAPRKGNVVLSLPCTVRSFSEASGLSTREIQQELLGLGIMATINMQLEAETAELLTAELDLEIEFKLESTLEESLLAEFEQIQDDPDSLVPRPPIVTFLGHVDHGKTSLLDQIIGTSVVDHEAGGITQHIRAYIIEKDGRQIAFVDTPGHEAFTEMRARGANVTDIAVLVVAADDGVMPQTEEAISHARAAEVPIIVALNKMDLPGADENRAMQDLASQELLPAEWGGDIEVVKTSATTGDGIDDLLETLLLTADLQEYRANPNRDGQGVCLEAEQEPGRGVVAKLVVQTGTLHVGDIVICGAAHGRVKAMYDTLATLKKMHEAGPSVPVNVTGFDVAPKAGDMFYVLNDIARARQIAIRRGHLSREQSLGVHTARISFEEFQQRLESGHLNEFDEIVNLNLILRADVQGSIEAVQKELNKLDHPEVRIRMLHASVGGITVGDVTLAHASQAVIVGFNVIPDEAARSLADQRGVEIRRYDVIYKITDDIKAMLEGKLKPEERAADLGRVLVKQIFSISRLGKVAGCHVVRGTVERGCRIRVHRDGRGIGDYPLDSLRREKDDVKEVREGMECGIKLNGFNDIKEGDILEAYKIEEIARTL